MEGNQVESRLTPEMLGLVKRSTLESQQKLQQQQKINEQIKNGIKVPSENPKIKPENCVDLKATTNGSKQLDNDDDDIKIINEKINVRPSQEIKKEEKIEVKLKPEEFILDDEEIGFPNYLKGRVTRGRIIPINKKTWTEIDIDGNDAILECPSQVVPLFIKKPHIFPPKEEKKEDTKKKEFKNEKQEDAKSEDAKSEDANDKTDKKDDNKEDKNESDNKAEKKEENKNEVDKKPEDEIKIDNKNRQQSMDKNNQQKINEQTKSTMLTIPDYFKSSVGSFLMGIGLRRCQETHLKESVKQTQKLIRKEGELDEHVEALKEQQEQFEDCKSVNSIYTFKQNKCTMCDFKTDSESVMQHHLSIPHLSNRKEFKCNFCTFLTRDARVIVYHFLNDHKKHCNIELPNQLHECPTCNYESNQKAKATTHMAKCIKLFDENKVQLTIDNETEYPAITSKLITQDDLKLYETTIAALKPVVMNPGMQVQFVPGLPKGLQQHILSIQQQQFARQKQLIARQPKQMIINQQQRANLTNIRSNNISTMANLLNAPSAITASLSLANANGANLINNINFAKAPQLYHMLQTGSVNNNQLIANIQQSKPQNVVLPTSANKLPQQFNNRVPQITSASMVQKNMNNIKTVMLGKAPTAKDTNGANKSDTFVICEICDGYIKDLEQLRAHMQWIHKVKIHPKMLASRPPLNCQKCQWRFFTDQGLERHLLGAHGLVTSNMQDLVDQNEDGGRCTICGKPFTSKLVSHMNQAHKVTLRPAHLSYKCTVCSATFNLYRLFENHVYMVHSGSMKRTTNEDQFNQLNKKPRTQTIEIGKVNGS